MIEHPDNMPCVTYTAKRIEKLDHVGYNLSLGHKSARNMVSPKVQLVYRSTGDFRQTSDIDMLELVRPTDR